MRADRSWIGYESPVVRFEVERGAIRRFAEAIGEAHPAHLAGDIAPPTFATSLRVAVPGPGPLSMENVLHGDEEYVYVRPLRAGDRIVVRRRIADVIEREGKEGGLTFVCIHTEGCDEQGHLVYRTISTIIQRA